MVPFQVASEKMVSECVPSFLCVRQFQAATGILARAIRKERTLFQGHGNRFPLGPVSAESDRSEFFACSEDKFGTNRQVARLRLSLDGQMRGGGRCGMMGRVRRAEVEQDSVGREVRPHSAGRKYGDCARAVCVGLGGTRELGQGIGGGRGRGLAG